MATVRPRISIDEVLWNAVEANAKALRIQPSTYIERALNMMLNPVPIIENAAAIAHESASSLRDTQDQIAVLSDYIVDKYRDETNTNGG